MAVGVTQHPPWSFTLHSPVSPQAPVPCISLRNLSLRLLPPATRPARRHTVRTRPDTRRLPRASCLCSRTSHPRGHRRLRCRTSHGSNSGSTPSTCPRAGLSATAPKSPRHPTQRTKVACPLLRTSSVQLPRAELRHLLCVLSPVPCPHPVSAPGEQGPGDYAQQLPQHPAVRGLLTNAACPRVPHLRNCPLQAISN